MPARPLSETALRKTPLHDRTAPLCQSFRWSSWNGYAAVRVYVDREEEHSALVNRVALLDHCPLRKLDLDGADAGRVLGACSRRDVTAMPVGGLMHAVLLSEQGWVRDRVCIGRLTDRQYRIVGSERNAAWFEDLGAGSDLTVRDRDDDLGIVSLRGPMAAQVVTQLVGHKVAVRSAEAFQSGGLSGWVQRHSTTHISIHVAVDVVGQLWDRAMTLGAPLGLQPCGTDAEEALRIASGRPRWGVDYVGSAQISGQQRAKTPAQAGLASLVPGPTDPAYALVTVEISWEHLANLYAEYGARWRWLAGEGPARVPVYDGDGRGCVGQLTSATWCPARKTLVAIAEVPRALTAIGTTLRVEHTVRYERRQVPATVVQPAWLSELDAT